MFRVIANVGAFRAAMSIVSKVAWTKSTKPILGCVVLRTCGHDEPDGYCLELTATDLERAIKVRLHEVQIEHSGTIAIPAARLMEILKKTGSDTIYLEETLAARIEHEVGQKPREITGTVMIRDDCSAQSVFSERVENFPPIPSPFIEPDTTVTLETMRELISRSIFAVARDNGRYSFNGLHLRANGKLIIEATDGRRLARTSGPSLVKLETEKRAIIPAKTAKLLGDICKAEESRHKTAWRKFRQVLETTGVGIAVRENQTVFRVGNVALVTNHVEGQFPPVDDVIPKETLTTITAARLDLIDALERVASVCSEESKGVALEITVGRGFDISAKSDARGAANSFYPCKVEGNCMRIGFNPSFLADGLRACPGDEGTIKLTAPNRPGLLNPSGMGYGYGGSFDYVLMPVNLQ